MYVRPKLLKLARKNSSEFVNTKGGEQIFHVLGGGKKRGDKIFSKILGGTKALHTVSKLFAKSRLSNTNK